MKFLVEHLGKQKERLGLLCEFRSHPDVSYKTPMTIITTKRGSAPHLTQDTLHLVIPKNVPLSVPTQHFCETLEALKGFGKGVAKFAALPDHSVCVTVQDVTKATPSGYNTRKGVSTWSHNGRRLLKPEKYMELVEALKPQWFEALNDADTDVHASSKRIQKSMANSEEFFKKCVEIHSKSEELKDAAIFAPLLGGHSSTDRKRWAESIAKKEVLGYSLLGIHNNGPTVESLTSKHLTDIVTASLTPLPEDRPRQALGAWSPLAVLSLVELGIDIFDCSLPFFVTERSAALIFPNSLSVSVSNACFNSTKDESLEHKDKKLRTSEDLSNDVNNYVGNDISSKLDLEKDKLDNTQLKEDGKDQEKYISKLYELDLKDKSNFSVQAPLLQGCTCHTCSQFTRSYIHHLVVTNELLAPVLLMIHNLHHWTIFFESIREAIQADQLPKLKCHLELCEN